VGTNRLFWQPLRGVGRQLFEFDSRAGQQMTACRPASERPLVRGGQTLTDQFDFDMLSVDSNEVVILALKSRNFGAQVSNATTQLRDFVLVSQRA
jgi:hypothetical protein